MTNMVIVARSTIKTILWDIVTPEEEEEDQEDQIETETESDKTQISKMPPSCSPAPHLPLPHNLPPSSCSPPPASACSPPDPNDPCSSLATLHRPGTLGGG